MKLTAFTVFLCFMGGLNAPSLAQQQDLREIRDSYSFEQFVAAFSQNPQLTDYMLETGSVDEVFDGALTAELYPTLVHFGQAEHFVLDDHAFAAIRHLENKGLIVPIETPYGPPARQFDPHEDYGLAIIGGNLYLVTNNCFRRVHAHPITQYMLTSNFCIVSDLSTEYAVEFFELGNRLMNLYLSRTIDERPFVPFQIGTAEGGRKSVYQLATGDQVATGVWINEKYPFFSLEYVRRRSGYGESPRNGDFFDVRYETVDGITEFEGSGRFQEIYGEKGLGMIQFDEMNPSQVSVWIIWSGIKVDDDND